MVKFGKFVKNKTRLTLIVGEITPNHRDIIPGTEAARYYGTLIKYREFGDFATLDYFFETLSGKRISITHRGIHNRVFFNKKRQLLLPITQPPQNKKKRKRKIKNPVPEKRIDIFSGEGIGKFLVR